MTEKMENPKPYKGSEVVDDIGDLARADTLAERHELFRHITARLRQPIVAWQMRWQNRFIWFMLGILVGYMITTLGA